MTDSFHETEWYGWSTGDYSGRFAHDDRPEMETSTQARDSVPETTEPEGSQACEEPTDEEEVI